MTVYDRPAATAQRLLTRFGAPVVITRTAVTGYDTSTGEPAVLVANATGIAFRENYALKDIDGTLVKAGDVRLLVGPYQSNGFAMPEPTTTDSIAFAGKTYSAVKVDPFNFSGQAVAFYVQAR